MEPTLRLALRQRRGFRLFQPVLLVAPQAEVLLIVVLALLHIAGIKAGLGLAQDGLDQRQFPGLPLQTKVPEGHPGAVGRLAPGKAQDRGGVVQPERPLFPVALGQSPGEGVAVADAQEAGTAEVQMPLVADIKDRLMLPALGQRPEGRGAQDVPPLFPVHGIGHHILRRHQQGALPRVFRGEEIEGIGLFRHGPAGVEQQTALGKLPFSADPGHLLARELIGHRHHPGVPIAEFLYIRVAPGDAVKGPDWPDIIAALVPVQIARMHMVRDLKGGFCALVGLLQTQRGPIIGLERTGYALFGVRYGPKIALHVVQILPGRTRTKPRICMFSRTRPRTVEPGIW